MIQSRVELKLDQSVEKISVKKEYLTTFQKLNSNLILQLRRF